MNIIINCVNFFLLLFFVLCKCDEEYKEFLTSSSNFFHNLLFDIGYGVRKCIENQNLYPYERIFIDKSDKNYVNDMMTGFFIIFSLIMICIFIIGIIYDIIVTPIRIVLTFMRWYKTIVIEEKRQKEIKNKRKINKEKDNLNELKKDKVLYGPEKKD
ncbi:Hypothetical protein SRAE_2000197800 [Strongyloides ratti]|uniref:Uncharacterized protein n=1 Tax=Strongyloides ratti TaxID=34506 RepID=A0A090MYJ9_STRRB|nr:Hypothetical protein SRAE_2000197800 [Strongyloides ratti]CEF67314.1 Hypothetical protein SRAE_2000197800 [Strongyloides ratti]